NIEGTMTKIGDYDAYNVSIHPCEGLTGTALADCEAGGPYNALAQVYIRDFLSELEPMLLATHTDRALFRGYGHVGRVQTVHPDYEPEDTFCTALSDVPIGEMTSNDFNGATDRVLLTGHGLTDGALVFISSLDLTAATEPL